MYDGSAIRELDGSLSGAINGIDICEDGKYFVTGRYLSVFFPHTDLFLLIHRLTFCHVIGVTGGTVIVSKGFIPKINPQYKRIKSLIIITQQLG